MNMSAYWDEAWRNLSATAPAALQKLLERYDEPHRHYHTRKHLQECFTGFDALREHCRHPGEVLLAIWFHDAVYGTRAGGSERASAELADAVLRDAGMAAAVRRRIGQLIMATCHQAEPATEDEAVLLDIDLAILGSDPTRYAQYEQQVRAEYDWVPAELFGATRARLLAGFLAQPALYRTAAFRARYEAQARINLEHAIAALSGA